eukprot:m51a1_g2231 hypothetical protein (232) ;mRNA; f:245355-246181
MDETEGLAMLKRLRHFARRRWSFIQREKRAAERSPEVQRASLLGRVSELRGGADPFVLRRAATESSMLTRHALATMVPSVCALFAQSVRDEVTTLVMGLGSPTELNSMTLARPAVREFIEWWRTTGRKPTLDASHITVLTTYVTGVERARGQWKAARHDATDQWRRVNGHMGFGDIAAEVVLSVLTLGIWPLFVLQTYVASVHPMALRREYKQQRQAFDRYILLAIGPSSP